jgi:cytochrome c biogenesis protein CcdA
VRGILAEKTRGAEVGFTGCANPLGKAVIVARYGRNALLRVTVTMFAFGIGAAAPLIAKHP